MKKTFTQLSVALLVLLFLVTACENRSAVPGNGPLPRSIPEIEGVSSQGIIDFLDAVARSGHEFHSFMFLRHGKVIAEGWWNPYTPELKHTMYSLSKSFSSTAIGFAVNEKRLTLQDKVISFFPEDLPDSISPFLAEMSVKDLLTMSAGQAPDPTFTVVAKDSNWVKAFLALPVVNEPGSKFLYNSLASYMLSAIVQKVTGEKAIDYLTPRLFEPLGIKGMDWEVDPLNVNTGGWGLRIKTEDMAKFGQFYLQKGQWNSKQLLSSEWVQEATTFKIQQSPELPQAARDTNDWLQGYCYQFWRCRNNAFRGDGAYGQFIVVMPDQDVVVVITAETQKMQDELNLVWKYLFPAIQNDKLPINNILSTNLKQRLASLALPLPENRADSSFVSVISDKTFAFIPNTRYLESILLKFNTDTCHLTMKIDNINYHFTFGAGKWITGETTKPGPNLLSRAKAHFAGLPPPKVAGCYGWKDSNTLELVLRYIESPHKETITCRFDQNKIAIDIKNSNSPSNNQNLLEGKQVMNYK
jgi:CubicO group peptidase (beta-lactamase class C family)